MQKISTSSENHKHEKRLVDAVGYYVEPLTRFDSSNLIEVKEDFTLIPIKIDTDQTVTFSISPNDGPGKLPSGVIDLADKSKYDLSLENSLRIARTNSKETIALWVKQDEGAYRRLLPGKAAFKFPPENVGYERTCDTCRGSIKVLCTKCKGHGNISCSVCGCTGKVNCHVCHGSTSITCGSCGGGGKKYVNESYSVWDSYAKVNRINYRQVAQSCSNCFGRGNVRCYNCTDGRVTCFSCGGRAYLLCSPCNGLGRVDCNSCKATGIQHRWATIKADVVVSDRRVITSDDDVLKNLIREKLNDLDEYSELGTIAKVSHSVQVTDTSTKLLSEHNLLIETKCAEIDVHGKSITFYGFGPNLKVVDFSNIAGLLLKEDLCNLEKSVVQGDLLQATLQFVESEVNLKIAEDLLPNGASKDVDAKIIQQFKGVVNDEYISRANSALSLALSKLFSHQFRFTSFWIFLIGLLAGLFMQLYKWPVENTFAIVAICVLSTLVVWLLSENIVQSKISEKFPALVSKRIYTLLKRSDGVTQMRVIFGVAFAIMLSGGLWGCDYATKHFPWVQQALFYRPFNDQSEDIYKINKSSSEAVTEWMDSKEPDLQLRPYLENSLLVYQLQQRNNAARTILAWKNMLGVGILQDIDGASALLAQSLPETNSEDYLLVARAVLTMHQMVKPDALRAAARNLDLAASRGMLEARYWEARLYLADHSALKNTNLGFRKLELAASNGHAHASYYLGVLLMEGHGIAKDFVKARKFLNFAQSKGVLEAQSALAKIK